MLKSFRSRLVLSNLLITLFGLLVVVVVFAQVLAGRNESIRRQDLTAESRLMAQQVEFVYQHHGPSSEVSRLVRASSGVLGLEVILVSPTGDIKVDSKGPTPYDLGSWNPLDRTALQHQHAASKQLQSSSLRTFQTPLRGTGGRPGGAVILVANVSDVRPSLASLRNVILIVLGTALLVWLAISLFFTFSISRPLLRITAATQRMAEGYYGTRVPAHGNGEIARLASRFNIMAEQVQGANQVLKDFVANVSHDLRTPLTLIAGFSEAMLDGTARDGEVAESAQVIHEEAGKMQHMVNDLLQLTRLESGLQTFRRSPVDVWPFIQGVVDRLHHAHTDQQSAQLENRAPRDLPPIDVDRDQLERALRNLLENGLQYTPATGSVRVGARSIGRGWVEISVTDSGSGIPAAELPRVFERFYRTDKGRERVHGHSGLGLAIVREIVEGHGGRIEVESMPQRGTTFRFTVPQAARAQPARDRSPERHPAGRTATR